MLKEKKQKWKHPVLLGKGAFSKVYRVTNEATGELAVCKISSQLELAEREAMLLEKIRHPLFPAYRGRMVMQDKHYLLMEYICGSTLQQYVEKRKGLSQERAVEILLELAKGLNYLHEQSDTIIFRDIKPENILIQQDGRVRLVDVGCAYVTGSRDGSRAGTKGYAAPEQLKEGIVIGRESDVYALGMLLGYMLKGQKGISGGLLRLQKRATEEDPIHRIPDMRTLILQLESYAEKGNWWQRLQYRRDNMGMGTNAGFYYKKNIHKET